MCWVISAYMYENDFFLSFLFRLLHPTVILYFRLQFIDTQMEKEAMSQVSQARQVHMTLPKLMVRTLTPQFFFHLQIRMYPRVIFIVFINALIIQTSCMKKHPWMTETLEPHIAIPQARQVSIPILFMSVFSYNISLSHLHRLNSFIDFSIRRRGWSSIHAQRRHWLSPSSRFDKPIKWAWYV